MSSGENREKDPDESGVFKNGAGEAPSVFGSGKDGSRRAYRTPPSVSNEAFPRTRKGKAGRPKVRHEVLDVVRKRLRKSRHIRRAEPPSWNRLRRFPQDVLFLTMAGYSSSFVCKVFLEELPNLYKKLSYNGVESSMNWVMVEAEAGRLFLAEDLVEVLSVHGLGPWAKDAPAWMREQYVMVAPEAVAPEAVSPEAVSPEAVVSDARPLSDEEWEIGLGGMPAILAFRKFREGLVSASLSSPLSASASDLAPAPEFLRLSGYFRDFCSWVGRVFK